MLPPPPTHTHTLLNRPPMQLSRPREQQDLHRLARIGMWTKLRSPPTQAKTEHHVRPLSSSIVLLVLSPSLTLRFLPPPPKLHMQLSRPREQQDLHRLVRMGMWTKLRPGVREFLQRAAELFELWIYTAGSKPYAEVCGRVGLCREGGGGEGRREGSSAATFSAYCVSPFTPEILQRVAKHFLLRIYSAGSKPLRMWVGAWRVL
jgi:hypothetical protein